MIFFNTATSGQKPYIELQHSGRTVLCVLALGCVKILKSFSVEFFLKNPKKPFKEALPGPGQFFFKFSFFNVFKFKKKTFGKNIFSLSRSLATIGLWLRNGLIA